VRPRRWALALHGGAGVIAPFAISLAQARAYREALRRAARIGAALLDDGASAVTAAEAVARALEDDPLFNAGRGSVFNAEGRQELDAAIMDGGSRGAGAVAGVCGVRHPVSLARAVMERSPHVMLSGAGAEAFAAAEGLERADPAFFHSEVRWRALEAALEAQGRPPPPRAARLAPAGRAGALAHDEGKHGTIGVVAVDRSGHVAAATSTGGVTAKRPGRIGDSPIIGAGCYACDAACAVSCTGTGEHFIRLVAAHRIAALVEFGGLALQAAADQVVQTDLTAIGGEGGVIAAAPDGTLAWSFNTPGMYRARISEGEPLVAALYGDEP
jgi:beta-aspartyl-peptidase (threonine type)